MELKSVYAIDDQPNPLNEYGRTKLLGEQAVQKNGRLLYYSNIMGIWSTVITLSLPCKISGNKRPTNGSGRSVWPPNLDKNVSRIYGICYCRKSAIWCLSFV